MNALANQLSDQGYKVVNLGYPSRAHKIEELAEIAIAPALERCKGSTAVNFVTHSLGGILVRQYLAFRDIPNLNHVVMLGPPNGGSEVVDKLQKIPGFQLVNGEAGGQLGTGELNIPSRLGTPNFDVGIIAGNRSINWMLSLLIPGVDDGKVSVEKTKLEGMHDHIELPVTHPLMMNNKKVIGEVIYYLQHGRFQHAAS